MKIGDEVTIIGTDAKFIKATIWYLRPVGESTCLLLETAEGEVIVIYPERIVDQRRMRFIDIGELNRTERVQQIIDRFLEEDLEEQWEEEPTE